MIRPDITLELRSAHGTSYEVQCPLLEIIAPQDCNFVERWECGEKTFDFLVGWMIEAHFTDEAKHYIEKIREGKWELYYRGRLIRCHIGTPEDRLWPA